MIEVQNLLHSYGRDPVIERVSFEVGKGEIVGFLGPNGSGKTTTMRILTGYMPMTRGIAKVDGYDTLTQSLQARSVIGYLPEHPPLYPEMTVQSYLKFVAKIKGISAREIKQRVEKVMEDTAIIDVGHSVIKKLSKGYKQRVGLAQALVHKPPVLIFDEPTVGLDPKQIVEVRELIQNLSSEHTIILSTHLLPLVSEICERVVIIARRRFTTNEAQLREYLAGTVVAEDTIGNLTQRIHGADRLYMQVDGPADAVKAELEKIKGIKKISFDEKLNRNGRAAVNRFDVEAESGRDVRRELAQAVVQKGWGLLELRAQDLDLEDAFRELTQDTSS